MKNTPTRMKLMGISPSLNDVKEASTIHAKTTPLAPQSELFPKSMQCMIPVVNAVVRITFIIAFEPYFSSNIGPTNKRYIAFPMKCSNPVCPKTWVNILK